MKLFIVALGLVAAAAIEQTVAVQASRSARVGVYSKEPAKRGQALYGSSRNFKAKPPVVRNNSVRAGTRTHQAVVNRGEHEGRTLNNL